MWQNHLEAIAAHKSKQFATSSANSLPTQKQPAPITINTTNIPPPPLEMESALGTKDKEKSKEKGKITAVVNVPQSRYEYHPLQPPIIETPQLRDMGEATPPLEWIGLNRDKLPNITHQVGTSAAMYSRGTYANEHTDSNCEFIRNCKRG